MKLFRMMEDQPHKAILLYLVINFSPVIPGGRKEMPKKTVDQNAIGIIL